MDNSNIENKNPLFLGVYQPPNVNKIPILFTFCGLPGSGKSRLANGLFVDRSGIFNQPVVHSSDNLRKELYGDENDQTHNAEIFTELFKRVKEDLQNGIDVCLDATNISKKDRATVLHNIGKIPCYKVCVTMLTPYEDCLSYNKQRDRVVPDWVIKKMYMKWCPPSLDEGFDDIVLVYSYKNTDVSDYSLDNFLYGRISSCSIDQDNPHHTLTIGEHCKKAYKYVCEKAPEDIPLQFAALIHDCGKPFTKSRKNHKGEEDNFSHYYQHQCVGAYLSMFMSDELGMPEVERVRVANLIYYHMHPLLSWRFSEKSKERDKRRIGQKMFDDIMLLNKADRAAH